MKTIFFLPFMTSIEQFKTVSALFFFFFFFSQVTVKSHKSSEMLAIKLLR